MATVTKTFTEPAGLAEGFNTEQISDYQNVDTTGLAESVDLIRLLDIAESLGLTDTATPLKSFNLDIIDTTGLVESTSMLRRLTAEDDLDMIGVFGGLPTRLLSFTEDLGLTDDGTPDFQPDEGTEQVIITGHTTMKRILAFTDSTGLTEQPVHPVRLFPAIGMSRPWTYDIGARDIINKIEMSVEKRYAYAQEIVWSDPDTRTVFPNEPQIYKVSSSDPFYDAIPPVPGIQSYSADQQIITPEVYDFLVHSGNVSATISRNSGQSLTLTVTALDDAPAVISNMTLRAIPVKIANTGYVSAQDLGSQALEGIRSPQNDEQPPPLTNTNDSKAIMEVILNQRFKKLPYIAFMVNNGSDIRMRSLLDMRLSDRLRLAEELTFTAHDYHVEQISHSIENAGTFHNTMIGCEQIPVRIDNCMVFDDPDHGFDVGVFGDRANAYDFDNKLFILGQSNLNDEGKVLGL